VVPGSNHTTLPTLVFWKRFTCNNFIYQTCLFNKNVVMITINNIFFIWLMFSWSCFHFHRSLLPFPASQTVFSIVLGTEWCLSTWICVLWFDLLFRVFFHLSLSMCCFSDTFFLLVTLYNSFAPWCAVKEVRYIRKKIRLSGKKKKQMTNKLPRK